MRLKEGREKKREKKKPGKFHTRQTGRPTQCVSLRYSRERERERETAAAAAAAGKRNRNSVSSVRIDESSS